MASRRLTRIALAALLVSVTGACTPGSTSGRSDTVAVVLDGRPFTLELALDDKARFRGLSDRESIPADGGMLFVFPDDRVGVKAFVMRRCLVPIDIIYLDRTGRIVAMHEMKVEPYDTPEWELVQYSSRYPAQFVIEVIGGTLRGMSLQAGDQIDLPLDRLKTRAR